MASATLVVTVNGGIAPVSIEVSLFKNGEELQQFEQTTTFTHLFDDLDPGCNYDITIGGNNPAGGNTSLTLSGNGITLTPASDPSPSVKNGIGYRVDFNFNT